MKRRSIAFLGAFGLLMVTAFSALISQQVVAQNAAATPVPTASSGGVCVPDQARLQSLCAGLIPAGGAGGNNTVPPGTGALGGNGAAPQPHMFPWIEIGGAALGLLIGLLVPAIQRALDGATRDAFGGNNALGVDPSKKFVSADKWDKDLSLANRKFDSADKWDKDFELANRKFDSADKWEKDNQFMKYGDEVGKDPGPTQNVGSQFAKFGDKLGKNPGPQGDQVGKAPGPPGDINIGNPDL